MARNWNREEVIRIHFGPVLDLSEHLEKPDRLRTHKEIADAVMGKIAELGEQDKADCRLQATDLRRNLRIEHVGSNR